MEGKEIDHKKQNFPKKKNSNMQRKVKETEWGERREGETERERRNHECDSAKAPPLIAI